LIREVLTRHEIEVVIFTTSTAMLAAPLVRRVCPQAIRIVNTENIEHQLLAQAMEQGNGDGKRTRLLRRLYVRALWVESNLDRFVDAYFACSDDDRAELEALNGGTLRGYTVPNGVDSAARPFDGRPGKCHSQEVLFCGGLSHAPNSDGLLWFHRHVWPLVVARYPSLRLTVVGRGPMPEALEPVRADPSVDFVGEVADVVPYYWRAGVSVVPLRMGSGTRLKILEAMSLGNPVVSTTLGAMGIEAVDGEHLLLADDAAEFADAMARLLSGTESFGDLRTSARSLVERKYDWRVIGPEMNGAIEELLEGQERRR
jgi:glycosyltransferase involved in cell wall biosynthesis